MFEVSFYTSDVFLMKSFLVELPQMYAPTNEQWTLSVSVCRLQHLQTFLSYAGPPHPVKSCPAELNWSSQASKWQTILQCFYKYNI